jgi:hypothetical protein
MMNEREVLDRVIGDHLSMLHTAFPAKVLAYDVAAQTLDVQPVVMRELATDDAETPLTFEALPKMLSVPIMWPRGGGYALTFPLEPGDWVLVVCAEQSIQRWRQNAEAPTEPGLHDPHGLNGCVALPGWFPDAQKLHGVSSSGVVLGKASSAVYVEQAMVYLGAKTGSQPLTNDTALKSALTALTAAITGAVTGVGLPGGTPPVTGAQALTALATVLTTWIGTLATGTTKVRGL